MKEAAASGMPFQLQFDKPIPFQIKLAEWNPEKDLLAMVTDDSKNGKMLRSIKSHDVAIVCLNWAEDEPLSRTDKAGLLSYEDHTTRFFPPAPVMPRIGGLNSGDTGLADDNEEAIQEFSSASCQCFNILGTGDKDGCICFSIFGIFPVGKIAWWEKTFSFSRSDGTQPLAFRFVFVAGKLQIQEEDNLRPVPEFGQTQILENLLYPGYGDPPVQPRLCPLMSSLHHPLGEAPATPSWQKEYMLDSQANTLPAAGGGGLPGSSPFGFFPLQSNLMENRSLVPPPIRQVNFF
ncbi:hypothetical protein ZWY2020_052040 [Hordeum vulgare]|nr:hypothetical protein ZWY2020_052040 [Hordeum vulgare]